MKQIEQFQSLNNTVISLTFSGKTIQCNKHRFTPKSNFDYRASMIFFWQMMLQTWPNGTERCQRGVFILSYQYSLKRLLKNPDLLEQAPESIPVDTWI